MSKFLRDNIAIVVGIGLPIVVVLFFVLASSLPKAYVDPPRHDLLLLSTGGPYVPRPMHVEVNVADGRLRVRAYRADGSSAALARPQIVPRLFMWSHETRSVREISLALPGDLAALGDGADIAVPELADRRLSTDLRAPDGYEFRTTGYDGGLFGLLFDRNGPRTMIAKDGAAETLRLPGDVPYWGAQFLAWVIE